MTKHTSEVRPTNLPPPVVPASLYDTDYYLHLCAGSEEWIESGGGAPSGLYAGSLLKAGLKEGDVVVDLGTGRGELLAVAVEMGASRTFGIEYSFDALQIARQTLSEHGVTGRASVVLADTRRLPLPDGFADLVTMLDIVEHLSPSELLTTFREGRRILRTGGRLFIHTLPTRTIYDVTYRLQRWVVPSRWWTWPANPRLDLERLMHINEQSRRSLAKALGLAGFRDFRVERGQWVHDTFVPDERARSLYGRLARYRLTAALGAADLWAEATR